MALPYTGAVEGSLWLFVWALAWLPWAYPACSISSQGEELLNFQILHHHIVPCCHMHNSQGIRGLEMVSAKINPLLCDFLWGRG